MGQPDRVLANSIVGDKAERRPAASEKWLTTHAASRERLNDVQLAAILHDVGIKTDPPISEAREDFFAGEKYGVSGRVRIVVRHIIRDNRICVTCPQLNAPPAVRCRVIFRDDAGNLYFARASHGRTDFRSIRLNASFVRLRRSAG